MLLTPLEIGAEQPAQMRVQELDLRLSAFRPADMQVLGIEIDIVEVKRHQFLQADARGEEGFDERAVAFGNLAVPTGQAFQQSPHLRVGQERRRRAWRPLQVNAERGVLGEVSRVKRPGEEGTDGGAPPVEGGGRRDGR